MGALTQRWMVVPTKRVAQKMASPSRTINHNPSAAAATVALCGCGDVCDDAAQICGFDIAETSADCSDANECASICIVDRDSCDVNNADAPVAKCIAKCLEEPEGT